MKKIQIIKHTFKKKKQQKTKKRWNEEQLRSIIPSLPGGGCGDGEIFSTNAVRFSNFASNFISKVLMAVQTSVPSQLSETAPDHKNHMYV